MLRMRLFLPKQNSYISPIAQRKYISIFAEAYFANFGCLWFLALLKLVTNDYAGLALSQLMKCNNPPHISFILAFWKGICASPAPHWNDMTEFKSCVSFSQDGRARENLLALYAIRKKKQKKSSILASTRVWATWSRARFLAPIGSEIYFTWNHWTFRAQAHLTFIFNPLQDCYG